MLPFSLLPAVYNPGDLPNRGRIHLSTSQSEPLLLGKSHVYHHNLPYVAHKRLVPYTHMQAPAPHNSVRSSVIANEIDRIQHRSRPHFSHVPTEDYLNSRAVVNFDDDVRSIRAHTAALLKRVQSPIPRAHRMPLSSAFDHVETSIPDRITSDAYISTMLSPRNNINRTVEKMTHYPEIHEKAYNNIGKGRLACVSFAGGKAYPRRRHIMVSGNGSEDARNVMADITMLSYYNKARSGAQEVATHEVPLYSNYRRSPEPYTPRSYYRLIRPYKPTKSAPAKIEIVKTEDDVEEDVQPRRTKKSLSRQATLEREQEEAAKLLAEEQEREAERIAAEIEREEAEREEKARLAKARLAEEKAEEERIAALREEEERLLAQIAEQERIAAEKAEEEEKLALERAEEERLAAEKEEAERLAAEEEERQRLEAERIEEERLEEERIQAEKEAEEERILAAQAEEQRYDQGRVDEERLAAELTENLLRIKAEKERDEEEEEASERDRATTEEPEESKKEDEYVSDEDNDKAVAESSEEEEEAKDELGDEGHPLVEYPVTPDVTGNENKNLGGAQEVTSSEEEEEE